MILEDSLIVALDVPNLDKASALVVSLGKSVTYYKVGMEFFYGAGADVVKYLQSYNKKVFLDLKLHDIPNTVGRSVEVLSKLGVNMLNLHASGGRAMMRQAAWAAAQAEEATGRKAPALIAVTILTSIDEAAWRQELHGALPVEEQALELAKLARDAGLQGVVASPVEAAGIRKACGEDFLIVTPGIRRAVDSKDDQNRVSTPQAALEAGASHIVVGRPITQAHDPAAVARDILLEMREAKV
jgi:orotidine-5'-phosphate decarboxylase